MAYNAVMNCLKKFFIHFLFFSFLMAVPRAACMAEPAQGALPPLPPEQERPFPERPDIMHYRGIRMPPENLPFEITQIKCHRFDDKVIVIHVIFNQSINPRSIARDSFLLNGKPFHDDVRFAFNRKGDTIKMIVIQKDDSFKLKVQKLCSFDGKELETTERLVEVNR